MAGEAKMKREADLYSSPKAYRRALEHEARTELPWLTFKVYELLASCRKRVPSLPEQPVKLFFAPSRILATIDIRPMPCVMKNVKPYS